MLTQTILNNRHILMAIAWCIMSLPLNAGIICPYICPYEHLPSGSSLIETLEKNRYNVPEDPRGLFFFDTIPPGKGRTKVKKMKATQMGDQIEVSFITTEEVDVEYFELHVSVDNDNFKSLEKIKPKKDDKEKKEKEYKYLDKTTKKGKKDAHRVSYVLYEVNKRGDATPLATTSQTLQSNTGPAGINQLLPQVTPKSPNVAAMERYGNAPISYYTGQPDIEIKIWDIKVGDMIIPIRLKYHPGGHKVLDNAPWTGLGWSVTGLYALTAQIRGMADQNGGLWNQALPNYPSPTISCLTETLKAELNQHIFFDKDLERDVFTYRTPLKTNSFVFTPNGPIFLEADKSIIEYSAAPNLLGTITVTDQNGNRFIYSEKESTFSNNVSSVTAWHLSSIETNQPGEKVRYTYQAPRAFSVINDITSYETWYTNVCVNAGSAPVTGGLAAASYHENIAIVDNLNPKEIFFPGGKIEFGEESTDRTDGYGRALNLIKIYGYNFMTGGYDLIRQFNLDYVYKSRQNTTTNAEKVLFLDKVRIQNSAGTDIGTYTMNYNSTALPKRSSYGKDLNGYFNGATSNTTLIPSSTFQAPLNCITQATHNIGGANRTPSESHMRAWQLTRLTYPTGGHTDYTYEAHRYDDSGTSTLVGGLRIKSMVSDDGNGSTETLLVKYGTGESGDGTHRDGSDAIMRTDQKIKRIPNIGDPDQSNYTYFIRHFASGVNAQFNPYESVPVTYPEVTVYEDINGVGSNGKTVLVFKDNAYDDLITHPATLRQVLQNEHWNRGQLISKTYYGSDGKKKRKIQHGYSELVAGSATEDLGYVLGRTEVRLGSEVLQGGCLQNDDMYNPVLKYHWVSGLTVRNKTEAWEYDDTDDASYVYALTEYDHDATYYQKEREQFYRSDGTVHVTRWRYCTDISGISASSTDHAGAIYQLIQNNELHRPVEMTHFHRGSATSPENVKSGTLSLSVKHTFAGHTYVLPDEIHLLAVDPEDLFSTMSFSPLAGSGTGLSKDPKYELRVEFDNYDSYGNLSKYHLPAGSPTSYTYTNVTKDGVYHTKINSKKENDSGNTNYLSHTTTFTHDVPLLGPTMITAPNGLKTHFEYDLFGRLLRIKDHDGKIIEEYEYNLLTGTRYVKTKIPREALTSTSGASHTQMETIIGYVDGLGRGLQTIHVKAQPNGTSDIVTDAVDYDDFSRAEKNYVPFGSTGGGLAALPSSVHGDAKPYGRVKLWDNSPLNRTKQILGPGDTWHSNNKYVVQNYLIAGSSVRKYELTSATSVGTPSTYGSNKIAQRELISEQGNKTTSYLDNQGKVVQEIQQQSSGVDGSTYTIYDQHDHIRYVVQPEKGQTSSSFTESSTYFNEGVFAIKYDKRLRKKQTHTPGGGWTSYVYDRLDRVVLSQNALQATEDKWTFSRYDALGRVIEQGELESTRSRSQLQSDFDGVTLAYEQWDNASKTYTNQSYPSSLSTATKEVRNTYYFDVYDIGSAGVNGINFDGAETNQSQYTNARGWLTWSFSDESEGHSLDFFRKYFYNNRSWEIQTIEGHHLGGNNKYLKKSSSYNFKGEVTGTGEKYQFNDLDDVHLEEEFIPDHKGRIKEYKAGINSASTTQICTTTFDIVGRNFQKIYYPGQSFTAGGGLDYIFRPPNPEAAGTEDIARKGIILDPGTEIGSSLWPYTADIDNQNDPTTITGLQTIDYTFNIRDWLIGLNLDSNNDPVPNDSEGDVFALKLEYEGAGRYDGNLAKQSWQVGTDAEVPAVLRSYAYQYDLAERITGATYSGGNGENYSVSGIAYDRNGNLTALKRNMASGTLMDNLTYTNVGNHLMKVEDAISGDHEIDFVNGNSGSDDYEYYPDGCLKKDLNENIDLIEYDTYLGKPIKVTLTTGEWIKYIYNGEGSLIKRERSDGVVWDYVGGMIVKDGQYYQLATAEGRAVFEEDSWQMYFEYRDQVGNLRVGFTGRDGRLQKTEVSDYSPFGIPINQRILTPSKNNFTFQGHEDQGDFGINMFDMKARCYNNTIGKFLAPDPLADQRSWVSPYNYVQNNPINRIDPTGMLDDPIYNRRGKLIGDDGMTDGKAYIAKGSVARDVKRATKAGEFYTGSLAESNNIMKVPTGGVMDDVISSVDATLASEKEHGGHSNFGDANATRWDEGPAAIAFTDKDGNKGAKASLTMFKVDGKNVMPSDASNVEFWWHTHPKTEINGIQLGRSTPSKADFRGQTTMQKLGFKGNTFVVGTRSNTVTFFNKNKSLMTIKYSTFKKIGGKQNWN